jgi:predicted AlkP superfamily phosphohydrolase/phosphomutase/Flp pilus assembly protein TadD
VKRRGIILVGVLVVLLIAFLWAVVIWVPSDGTVQVWAGDSGILQVPARGPAFIPRWSGSRSTAAVLVAEVNANTSDGSKVGITATFRPPVGVWHLQPATTADEGLRRAIVDHARRFMGEFSVGCLTPGAAPSDECPADPAAALGRVLALKLLVPEGAMAVELEPEADSVRASLLSAIADKLPDRQRKLLVVGLDAVDWDFALPLVERGLMPNLARLMGMGTWGEMETLVPMLSPLIWTSMATGVSPDEHGILDFIQRDPETGEMLPITSNLRKVPAIWNMASALGKTTDVVAWWATWPAERLNGVMISDRLYFSLTQGLTAEGYSADRPDVITPAEREQEFRALRARAVDETDWKAVRYFINISEDEYLAEIEGAEGWENPIDGFRRTLIATRLYFSSALLLAEDRPDLMMVYIEGTDEVGHIMAPYMPPATLDVSPEQASLLAGSVSRYFQAVDRWIGRLLEAYPPDLYTILIVSDHGFKWADDRPKGMSGTSGATAALWHKQPAVYVLAGKDVERRGRVEEWKTIYDVAPTIAAILGIPPDEGWSGTALPGSPVSGLPPIEYAPLVPPSSYQTSSGGRAESDAEIIAKLSALGYIGGGDDVPAVSAGESTPIPTSAAAEVTATPLRVDDSGEVTPGQINNLAVVKINQKKYDEAIDLLNQLIALRPQEPGPHFNLRRIYMETGRYDDADRELWMAIDRGFRDSERTIDRAAADYEAMEMPERADALLTRAIERFPEHEPFFVHLMVTRIRLNRCADALPVGAVAAERFPESGAVHSFYGVAAACVGQNALARQEIERALEINPDQPILRETLQQLQGAGRN